jgi:hypothetical protein
LTRDLGVNLAGVEVILNMRRKIQQMQGEVNEFMEYVKSEMTRGIDDWEQRLSTAMVKSTSTDLVRVNQPAAGSADGAKKTRALKKVRAIMLRASAGATQSSLFYLQRYRLEILPGWRRSNASRAATAGATTSTSGSWPTRAFRAATITARLTTSSPTTTTPSKTR